MSSWRSSCLLFAVMAPEPQGASPPVPGTRRWPARAGSSPVGRSVCRAGGVVCHAELMCVYSCVRCRVRGYRPPDYGDPRVLLLDEGTSALDTHGKSVVRLVLCLVQPMLRNFLGMGGLLKMRIWIALISIA